MQEKSTALERYLLYKVFDIRTRKPKRKARRGPARDAKYRAWIRTLPSVVSGRMGCEAAISLS
jgi:hypothetical protein